MNINNTLFKRWLFREIVIHCDTKEKSDKFLSYCKSKGLTWGSGDDLEYHDYYNHHRTTTCYIKDADGLRYASRSYYEGDFIVINFDKLFLGDCDNCDICNTCNKERCTKNDIS